MKKKPIVLTPAALEQLVSYRWPGNVRELQNCIERAVILAEGDAIQPRHLNLTFQAVPAKPEPEADPWAEFEMSGSLSDVGRRAMSLAERLKIQQVLREADNNKGRAAELLQITYKTLLSKVKEHRLE
jgi:DNA-binding NtrC family response regulator